MKTETVINKTKSEIRVKTGKYKRLASDYLDSPINTKKAKNILAKMKSMRKEKSKLTQLLNKMERKKKTMKTMEWKRDKSLVDNIEKNLK